MADGDAGGDDGRDRRWAHRGGRCRRRGRRGRGRRGGWRGRRRAAGRPACTRRRASVATTSRPRARGGGAGAGWGSRSPPTTREEPIIGGDEGRAEVLDGDLPSLGKPRPCDADPLRFVARARRAGRRQERRIGLDEHAIERDERGDLGRWLLAGPEHEPREAHRQPEVDDRAAVVERARVRVDDRRRAVAERGRPARSPTPGCPELGRAARPGRRAGRRPSGSAGWPACRSRARAPGCGAGWRAGPRWG